MGCILRTTSRASHSAFDSPGVRPFSLFTILVVFLTAPPVLLSAQQSGELEQGIQFFESARYSEAKRIFESLLKEDSGNCTVAYYLGRTCFEEGDYRDSAKWLEKSVDLKPDDVDYHRWLVKAYEEQAEDAGMVRAVSLAKKMISELEVIIDLDPAAVEELEQLAGFHLNAPKIVGGGDIEKARVLAGEIRALDELRGCLAFIEIYKKEERVDLVEVEYRRLIEKFPDRFESYRDLGLFYHDAERYTEAVEIFRMLTERIPEYLYGWYLIGRTAAVSGQELDLGAECLTHYLRHEPEEGFPSHAAAHWRLGMIFEHKSDLEGARAEYEASLELDPGYEAARDALKRIRK